MLCVLPSLSFVEQNILAAQFLWLRSGLCKQNGHLQRALHTTVHPVVLPPSLWALRRSQFEIGGLGLGLVILALRRLRSHILEIITANYKCAPTTQAYSLGILALSGQYTS